MQIPVNKNIDDYKEDFFKGLTIRQTVTLTIALIAGVVIFGMLSWGLLLPPGVSMYLAFPATFLIAAGGFLKVHGMDMGTYLKKKRAVKKKRIYHYEPQMLRETKKRGGKGFEKDHERI